MLRRKSRSLIALLFVFSIILPHATASSKVVIPSAVTPGYGGDDGGFLWKGPRTVSSGSYATEALFLTGSYPLQGDGYDPEQLLIVTSVTKVDNEPLCHFSTCYFIKSKWVNLKVISKPPQGSTFVRFTLLEKLSNEGTSTPSNYQYVEATVNFIRSVIFSLIPGGSIADSTVQLMKDLSATSLYTQESGLDSISEQLAPTATAGAMFEVVIQNRNTLPGGTFYYTIKASSKVDICSDTHLGWLGSPKTPKTVRVGENDKEPQGLIRYEGSVGASNSYTLKLIISR